MDSLSRTVIDYVISEGACAAGIVTAEGLAGGPPSTDLGYVVPGAKSAVAFALPLDPAHIEPFLARQDRLSHEADNFRVNLLASGLGLQLASFLDQRGFAAGPVAANDVYRPDASPHGRFDMHPDLSLRYLAARCGVGAFGKSGNLLHPEHGAAIILGAVVTTAEMTPTDPLPPEANYCDDCGLCQAVCASGLMDPQQRTEVELGGEKFGYSKRREYLRCEYVCGGFTGLHPSGRWSTWSPGRFDIPERDEDFLPAIKEAARRCLQWPAMGGGHYHSLMKFKLYLTCGQCQLVCVPDLEQRRRRHRLVVESGVIVQNPDGSLEAVHPEQAQRRLAAMPPDRRELYVGSQGGLKGRT
jgi:epoxyqueuosine reductase QueG